MGTSPKYQNSQIFLSPVHFISCPLVSLFHVPKLSLIRKINLKIFPQTAVCGIREVNSDEFARRVRVRSSRSGCPQMPGLYVLSPFYVLKRLEREKKALNIVTENDDILAIFTKFSKMCYLEYLESSSIHILFTQRVVYGICTSMHFCASLLYFTG
jgi:hypothetical protein